MNRYAVAGFALGRALVISGLMGGALLISGCAGSSSEPVADAGASANAAPPVMPAPTYSKTVKKEVAITMDDGVRLGATVTYPSLDGTTAAPGKFPVVLSITPYSRNVLGSVPDQPAFATRGMIGAVVDTRGTGGSEGNLNENYFSPREARDSAALIEYFGTQDYSSGRVGMAGGSYVGITQLLAAEQPTPHLRVIVPQVALSDLYRDAYAHGGIMNMLFDAQYIAVQGAPGYAGFNTEPALLEQTVSGKIQQLLGTPILFDYLARPNDDPFYRDRSPIYNINKIKVPVLIMDGWRDGFIRGATENFTALAKRSGVETRLYIDPCTHKGCGAPFAPFTDPPGQDDAAAIVFEFLAKYLLDTPVPKRSAVRAYMQASNHYIEANEWPPRATQFQKLYLSQSTLTSDAPTSASSANYFTNPVAGLSMAFDFYGTVAASPYIPTDQRLEGGQGLTFRSEVLQKNLTLLGPSVLHLVASSSATDTDWVVKLADVAPDGSEAIITNGYLRASHRELDTKRSRKGVPYHTHVNPTDIVPNKSDAYEVEIWPTAYELAVGHRLQVRITSYDVPTHAPAKVTIDRNNLAATQVIPMLPAINTVMEGGSDPSSLLIPVYEP